MVTVDEILGLLTPKRQRYVLYYLDRQDGPVPVDEVVRQVATWETDPGAVTIPGEKFERIRLELHHNHLPDASGAEFIEYDEESGTINLTDEPPEFETFLTLARVLEQPESTE